MSLELTNIANDPLKNAEKATVAQWKERGKNCRKSPIIFKEHKKEDGSISKEIETASGTPMSGTEGSEILSAALSFATGANDPGFGLLLYSCCTAACSSWVKKSDIKCELETGIINALHALQPKDEIEGMLITRLISLHTQSMYYLSLTSAEGLTPLGMDANINRSTKLIRLYNETLETLMRYRRRGDKIVVQNVSVNDSGKAIINGSLEMTEKL
jgi:hypothetical protein